MMQIVEGTTVIANVGDRPIGLCSIIRVKGTNYTVISYEEIGAILQVERRGGLGQAATPDYDFDAVVDDNYPRNFRVLTNVGDALLGAIYLTKPPQVKDKVVLGGKTYTVVDWSIGQRRQDELYVK